MKRIILSMALLISAFMLNGCVKLWQKTIDIQTYMIRVERTAAPLETSSGKKLWIDEVYVQPPFNVRSLVTRENEVKFTTSYYSELLMSPSENFQNGFFNWLSASGMFDWVTITDRKDMSHRLVITVTDFYGDVPGKQVVLRIKLSLLDEISSENKVLLHKDYERKVSVAQGDADGYILAYNEAFAEILREFEKDAVSALQ
ncbi:ABC-type transport auxiliary lipoprotein family protein [Pontiellaceae bacterium B12227]|nr:ABC-type transport auxiliary lipoprotein family protein [Pontiellaceae bacterium B12227]